MVTRLFFNACKEAQMFARVSQFLACVVVVSTASMVGCGGSADTPAPPATATTDTPAATAPTTSDPAGNPTLPAGLLSAPTPSADFPAEQFQPYRDAEDNSPKENMTPVVVLKTSLGDVKIRLRRDKAPITVANFLNNYVDNQFYEGTVFHFVETGFMIAGGGFDTELKLKETRPSIVNESNNGLKNIRGAIGMIRNPEFSKSATSQFYINLGDNKNLDYTSEEQSGYCVFGEVLDESMPVVQRIAEVATHDVEGFAGTPVEPVVITGVQRLE